MAASTSGFSAPGGWNWPENLPGEQGSSQRRPASEAQHDKCSTPSSSGQSTSPSQQSGAGSGTKDSAQDSSREQRRRYYEPRTCRICLETVLPTFHQPSESLPGMLQGRPYVSYKSEEGRLIRPCKCKGSSRYVHESCLQEWRHADPDYGKRNFWVCPTCGFRYRLERMQWGRWISSQCGLTWSQDIFVISLD